MTLYGYSPASSFALVLLLLTAAGNIFTNLLLQIPYVAALVEHPTSAYPILKLFYVCRYTVRCKHQFGGYREGNYRTRKRVLSARTLSVIPLISGEPLRCSTEGSRNMSTIVAARS